VSNKYSEVEKSIIEIQQSRSDFQLKYFVIGQHRTPEMQFYQTCLELQDMIHKHQQAQVSVKIQELKIERLRSSGDELDELKAQTKEIGLRQTRLAIIGAERELNQLIELWESFEHKYTREEIEAAQFDYWSKRLTGNAKAMLMGGSGVNASHIEAMEQAGVLDSLIAEVQESKKELGL
jgi:primase-polymerase (primpol)-like protein